jgi:hypothetical protein
MAKNPPLPNQTVSPTTIEVDYFRDVPFAVLEGEKPARTKIPKQPDDGFDLEDKVAVVANGRSFSWHGFQYNQFPAVTLDLKEVDVVLLPKVALPDFLNCGFWKENLPQSDENPYRRGMLFVELG